MSVAVGEARDNNDEESVMQVTHVTVSRPHTAVLAKPGQVTSLGNCAGVRPSPKLQSDQTSFG